MNLRNGFRRGTAFLMALLMILMLSGHGTEIVFAEETTNVQAGVDFTALDDHLVEGMTPKGTRIHLFDYWSTQREANDRISNSDDGGINAGHDFKFTHGSNGFDNMNAWTGSSNPRTGIVKNKLGENGYPEFSKRAGQKEESLDYIFDPSIRHEGTNLWETLEYEVIKTIVTVPNDMEAIQIVEGEEFVTLVTCHPYGDNAQRYVVYCKRIHQTKGEINREVASRFVSDGIDYESSQLEILKEQRVKIIGFVLFGAGVFLFLGRLIWRRQKRRSSRRF